jgi:hypothetical protein
MKRRTLKKRLSRERREIRLWLKSGSSEHDWMYREPWDGTIIRSTGIWFFAQSETLEEVPEDVP